MAQRRLLALSPAQAQELQTLRDHAPLPYLRERAAALLKIAAGQSAHQVAQTGLLRVRDPDTVYRWLDRYQAHGVAGLRIRPGRGRKPSYTPQTAQQAQAQVLDVVRRDPHQFGHDRARWTLALIGQSCPWLQARTAASIWQKLHHLHIHWKRGRTYVHSPDPHYQAKRAAVQQCLAVVRARPTAMVALFVDEITWYRQPTVANDYELAGPTQPLARRSHGRDLAFRTIGALQALTGHVVAMSRAHLTVAALVHFWQQVRQAYPQAERIFAILDNWPVHFHPDVLVALEPQESPWPFPCPPSWPTEPSPEARRRWGALQLPIQLVLLPTYASWLNPIEKLWRWLRQDVLHQHRGANDWPGVRAAVARFLGQFAEGSAALLHYVGLTALNC
jgi:transposase